MRTFPPKQCAKCGLVKPRTDAYFDRKASRDSFKPYCKKCDTQPRGGDAYLYRMADRFRPAGAG